ncbi:DUF6381 family protein [Streptomyces violascens]|uniref:DUF6381 family protein n=1 Tax=Streptomyces violascens TaxID=67381 RepID=UPI001E3F4BEE|nr:DUF6381 family protein [Streptomyces violascens]
MGDEYRARARVLWVRAGEWRAAARQATDPDQRQRLLDTARRVQEESEQARRRADGDPRFWLWPQFREPTKDACGQVAREVQRAPGWPVAAN